MSDGSETGSAVGAGAEAQARGCPAPAGLAELLPLLAGRFIVFDGPDGSGKSTQLARLQSAAESAGLSPCRVREPGGTAIGERIREVLLSRGPGSDRCMMCEMLLFMASRAELVEREVLPALRAGRMVLSDRYLSSTLAYQGTAGGLDLEDIRTVGRVACRGVLPDVTVIFDVGPEEARRRMSGMSGVGGSRGGRSGRLEEPGLFMDAIEARGLEHQALVRRGYLEQASSSPERYLVVDASGDELSVWELTVAALASRLGALGPVRV